MADPMAILSSIRLGCASIAGKGIGVIIFSVPDFRYLRDFGDFSRANLPSELCILSQF